VDPAFGIASTREAARRMESDPDRGLVRDLQSADPGRRRHALATLYERHAEGLLNVAWRVAGDRAAAEDVVQDVFLSLEERVGTFRGESSLSSWLYRITVNRAIDQRRHENRRPALRLGGVPEDLLHGARTPAGLSPEAAEPAEPSPEEARLHAALARLSPKLRAIAVLRYVEGLSYEQLAEVLGANLGTVKSRLNRAQAALAKALGLPPPGR
jgi:RNA polymerase sigma-70 factor (ECF subfamily)